MTTIDPNRGPLPGHIKHPAHPHQDVLRIAELHFLQSLRTASESQLLQMRRTFTRIGTVEVRWKLEAVKRALSRMYEQWRSFDACL